MSASDRLILEQELPVLFAQQPPQFDWLSEYIVVPVEFADSAEILGIEQDVANAIGQFAQSDNVLFDGVSGSNYDVPWGDLFDTPQGQSFPIAYDADQLWHPGQAYRARGGFPTPDAYAFYLPRHFYPEDIWGIYLTIEGLALFAWKFHRQTGHAVTMSRCIQAARVFMYAHEFFHHAVESFAFRLEVDRRVPIYRDAFQEVFRDQQRAANSDEEALANAYAIQRLVTAMQKWKWSVTERKLVLSAVLDTVRAMPSGYSRGADLFEARGFDTARDQFAELNHAKMTGNPPINAGIWRNASHMFRGLENAVTHANYLIPYGGWIGARVREHVRLFSRKALLDALQDQADLQWVREGGSHEIWRTGTGQTVVIPRHRELPEGTVRGILRSAGVKLSINQLRAI